MNKHDFMNKLYALLSPIKEPERRDIMRDFEEHFAAGAEKGKSEEQICRELGSPEQVASQFLTPEQMQAVSQPSNASKTIYKIVAILLIIGLVVAIPAAVGCIFASLWIIIIACVSGVLSSSWILFGLLASISVLLLCIGILIILISVSLIKYCWRKGGI